MQLIFVIICVIGSKLLLLTNASEAHIASYPYVIKKDVNIHPLPGNFRMREEECTNFNLNIIADNYESMTFRRRNTFEINNDNNRRDLIPLYPQVNREGNKNMQIPTTVKENPLIKQVPTASVGILFGLLIWRTFTAQELASQFTTPLLQYLSIPPLILLLLVNIAGFIVNIIKPINFKNQMKFILGMNVVREWIELIYNVIMMAFYPKTCINPREAYFGRFLMNIWWTALCSTFSKSRWVLQIRPAVRTN